MGWPERDAGAAQVAYATAARHLRLAIAIGGRLRPSTERCCTRSRRRGHPSAYHQPMASQ